MVVLDLDFFILVVAVVVAVALLLFMECSSEDVISNESEPPSALDFLPNAIVVVVFVHGEERRSLYDYTSTVLEFC